MGRSPWTAALDIVRSLPRFPALEVCDLGCGDGTVIEALRSDGCRVRGTTFLPRDADHVRHREYPAGLPVDHGVDLTRDLPLPTAAFDVALCLEVIEHLESHSTLVREIARILRPDGLLVLTTPNLGRLVSRLHFAATGVHLTKERRPTGRDPLETRGAFHVRCPDFPLLHWILWQNGLRIQRLETTQVKLPSTLLGFAAPLLRPLVAWALRRHQTVYDDASRDLARWMRCREYESSEHLCVVAQAPPQSGHGRAVGLRS